jgi:glycosyltransferase involved in cell wall biosynthesis
MITGLLRVRNESRWIHRVVASLRPLCDQVIVMDDHSSDRTAAICAALPRTKVLTSPFDGLDETRDKNWLLGQAPARTDWIVMIDGDEILLPGREDEIRAAMGRGDAIGLRVLYAWDSEDLIRVDGVYGAFRRASIFRNSGARFESRARGGFHCGNAPAALRHDAEQINVPLLHLGYRDRTDRIRKYRWYNEQDPHNHGEDCYRHMVQGDLAEVPASVRLMHAGPLELRPIEEVALCPASAVA